MHDATRAPLCPAGLPAPHLAHKELEVAQRLALVPAEHVDDEGALPLWVCTCCRRDLQLARPRRAQLHPQQAGRRKQQAQG